jgi:hypothetical protein
MATAPPVRARRARLMLDRRQAFERLVDVGLQRHRLPPRRPSSAVMTSFDSQSSMRPARLSGEKPPNTTEWMAPMRAQASMAYRRLGDHRQVDGDAVALLDAERLQHVGERQTSLVQLA